MLKINEKNRIDAKDIYAFVEVKTPFTDWLRRCIDYADLQKDKDFYAELLISTGGRPATKYEFTIDAAKEMCIVSATSKAKELRRWLIGLSTQRENLELITVKEAAFAVKVVNCLKYINNQKESYVIHKDHYVEQNTGKVDPNYIYSDFAKYRAAITGWSKDKVDAAIDVYLSDHSGHNRTKLMKEAMSEKLSLIDINEAIRVAVLDILYANESDANLAERFSRLCQNMAKEMKVVGQQKNEDDLFKHKEDIVNVKSLAGESKRLNR